MTNEPLSKYTIGLYDPKIDTSNLRQGEPIYFTTTDETGNYLIQNIKAGKYIIYGFNDTNDNLINESASETFSYYDKPISLSDTSLQIDLLSYKTNQDTLKLLKTAPVAKDFAVKYNKGIEDYQIISTLDSTQNIYSTLIDNAKTIQIFKENFVQTETELDENDSIAIVVTVYDSIGRNNYDTVYAKFRNSNIINDQIKIKSPPDTKLYGTKHKVSLNFNKPVHAINYDSIVLKIGDTLIKHLQKDNLAFNTFKNKINISFNITQDEIDSISNRINKLLAALAQETLKTDSANVPLEKSLVSESIENKSNKNKPLTNSNTGASNPNMVSNKLHLYLGHGAFIGIEKDSTEISDYTFEFKDIVNYGTISGEIIGKPNNFIIELLKENYTVVDTIRNINNYLFKWVSPGKYKLRVIIDSNNNGKWDAGNPLLMTPSENIIHFNEVITVKANWEIIEKNIVIETNAD
jgi:uncharacterized protein (DUF2141 family)